MGLFPRGAAFFPPSALVPLHGLHVFFDGVWLIVMMVQVIVFGLAARVKINILRLGLFWHFLDIVWIAIFSVVYLHGLNA
jgi:cytochrome o ubiquinol oxidase subunit 3